MTKNFKRFLQASEGTTSTGNKIYRVVAEGSVSDLPIQWNYYLVSNPDGRQVVFAFTLEEIVGSPTRRQRPGSGPVAVVRRSAAKDCSGQPTVATPKK